jgi:hypothetical protein
MNLAMISSRYILICLALFLGLESAAQPSHDQYLLPVISGTGITKDFKSLSGINIPFKGITLQTDDTTSY